MLRDPSATAPCLPVAFRGVTNAIAACWPSKALPIVEDHDDIAVRGYNIVGALRYYYVYGMYQCLCSRNRMSRYNYQDKENVDPYDLTY
jgi:hypothetical protein